MIHVCRVVAQAWGCWNEQPCTNSLTMALGDWWYKKLHEEGRKRERGLPPKSLTLLAPWQLGTYAYTYYSTCTFSPGPPANPLYIWLRLNTVTSSYIIGPPHLGYTLMWLAISGIPFPRCEAPPYAGSVSAPMLIRAELLTESGYHQLG